MKIYFNNNNQGKTKAFITHNDQHYELEPGHSLDLKVGRGDQLRFKVGRLSAEHDIDFQSPNTDFEISPNRTLVYAYLAALIVILFGMWYLKSLSNLLLSVLVIIGLVIFEVFNYYRGYQAHPLHEGTR